MSVNANVQKELDRLAAEQDAGMTDGYDTAPGARAEFCRLFFKNHSRYERGYILGALLAESERERDQQRGR